MAMTAPPTAPSRDTRAGRSRLSRREDAVTLLLSLWLIIGLFVDGWAHNRNDLELESFFTPWHALFYSGFTACAAWFAWLLMRGQEGGRSLRDAIPVGYGLGFAGLPLFAIGGAGDFIWHAVFGVEQDLEALFSPTHLVLMVAMALIVTSPLRAAWHAPHDRDAMRLTTFLPALLSLTLLASLAAFAFMYFSSFVDISPASGAADWDGPGYPGDGWLLRSGIASALLTNLIVVVPVLHLLRRWRPPFGSVTVLLTALALMVNGLMAFQTVVLVVPAVVAGLVADVLIQRLCPEPARPVAYRAFGALLPLVLWAGYYLTLHLGWGLAWSLELWSGMIVYNALAGLLLAQLFLPVRAVDRSATPSIP